MRKIICLSMVLILVSLAHAELFFAPIFNDGAVLQCEMPVNIWGKADPGATVTVSFAGQEKRTVASGGGEWKLQLDPMAPSSEPRKLTATSSIGNQQSSIGNVLIGEVWLATGQSNMVMPLNNSHGGEDRLKMTLPNVRFTKVPQQTGLPPKPFSAEQLAWHTFEPGPNVQIAAVAFYFAEHLQMNVGGVVGIIQSSYGGTPCEAWTPAWALDEKPELKYYAEAVRKAATIGKSKEEWLAEADSPAKYKQALAQWNIKKEGPRPAAPAAVDPGNPWSSKSPTVLFENMIVPLIPYTARGVIWYQGEGNSGKPDEYRILFPAMIEAWRKVWNSPERPFFFVQLAAYNHPNQDWPGLRAAQTFTRDTVKNTGMALAIDCGEKENIHPRAKQPVGERLARLALDQVYGQKVVARGPDFKNMKVQEGRVLVEFFYTADGLKTSGGKADVPGFEVAGADGKFYPAPTHIIAKDKVELTCVEVPKPISVRYAWHNWVEPPVTLENSAGLPAEPFAETVK